LRTLSLRHKLIVQAGLPTGSLLLVALWLAVGGDRPGLAMFAFVAAGLTLVTTVATGVDVIVRVGALTRTADELASRRLPGLLDQLLEPAVTGGTTEPAALGGPDAGDDELDALASAITRIETSTWWAMRRQQVAVKDRLGEIVANVVRGSQSLLDRRIGQIDWLEATSEPAADRPEHLFELDHLATRMRRISQSALVLAGVESPHVDGDPIPLTDVLRVAKGETERYHQIRLAAVDEVSMACGPASDLAHLLSELLENATQHTPAGKPVELRATRLDDGRHQVTVTDHGAGMTDPQREAANRVLADPGSVDLTIASSTGLVVVGRLARRLDATVRLVPTPGSGLTAEVTVPASIVVAGDHSDPPVSHSGAIRIRPPRAPGADPQRSEPPPSLLGPDAEPPAALPAPPAFALPARREKVATTAGKATTAGEATTDVEAAAVDVPASSRAPEEVRTAIARYRDGLRCEVEEIDR
jgi:signal transduction histidine kinase